MQPNSHNGKSSYLIRLGKRIKVFRSRKGYSIHQLSGLCGMEADDLKQIEAGEKDIPVDTLLCISNFLNIPLEDLISN